MSKEKRIAKWRRIVGCVLLGLVAAAILYCAAVMIYRLVATSGHKIAVLRFLAEFGILTVLSFPAFDLACGIFSWSRRGAAKVAGIVLRVLSIVICAVFVAVAGAVVITGAIRDKEPVETVCVLGNAIDGDRMTPDLISRLDTTLAYVAEHPDVYVIVTGGNSEDPYYTEAAYMERYLLEHGLAPERLATEPQATTTIENFEYVAEMVDKTQPLAVITTNHHMFRATHLAKKQGYTDLVKIPAPTEPWLYGENLAWESICCVISFLQGSLAL